MISKLARKTAWKFQKIFSLLLLHVQDFSSPSGKCFRSDSSLVIGMEFCKLSINILHCLSCSFTCLWGVILHKKKATAVLFRSTLGKAKVKILPDEFFKETMHHSFPPTEIWEPHLYHKQWQETSAVVSRRLTLSNLFLSSITLQISFSNLAFGAFALFNGYVYAQ